MLGTATLYCYCCYIRSMNKQIVRCPTSNSLALRLTSSDFNPLSLPDFVFGGSFKPPSPCGSHLLSLAGYLPHPRRAPRVRSTCPNKTVLSAACHINRKGVPCNKPDEDGVHRIGRVGCGLGKKTPRVGVAASLFSYTSTKRYDFQVPSASSVDVAPPTPSLLQSAPILKLFNIRSLSLCPPPHPYISRSRLPVVVPQEGVNLTHTHTISL